MSASRGRVVVVGGGNAGVEAALAAAALGREVTLLCMSKGRIGELSCNPAIGGVAKGTLVREISALGGAMGRSADEAELQFRMLNVSKGPAVWGPRKQQDLGRYMELQRGRLETAGVRVENAEATALEGESRLTGVVTEAGRLEAEAVVIAAGTFLGGRLYRGMERWSGGRAGDRSSVALEQDLKRRMFHVKRFKTGTPARILAGSLCTGRMERQREDGRGYRFSPSSGGSSLQRGVCWITHTNRATIEAAIRGTRYSPLLGGSIEGSGPRYCPSFEDKVFRFPERVRHPVYVEPMGGDGRLVYPSGLSTSLDRRTQMEMIRSVPGLEQAKVARFGYAVEYGWLAQGEFDATLKARGVENLFFAGQICGTSGYEEAAALGLLAGANAARVAMGKEPRSPNRMDSYLGVMVDDLVERGTEEPYRLFSSRAENRLYIRQDNAPRRMAGLRKALFGSIPQWQQRWCSSAERARKRLEEVRVQGESLAGIARRPEVGPTDLRKLAPDALVRADDDILASVVLDLKYEGYIRRAKARSSRMRLMRGVSLDSIDDYMSLKTITIEARQALNRCRPRNLEEAAAIPAVRHTDLEGLLIHVQSRRST